MDEACKALEDGALVIYPTETFYALGCNALNPDAIGATYALKKRPYRLPMPVVIGHIGQLEQIVSQVLPVEKELMDKFWPGPLSIIFSARKEVPDLLTANTGRVAVRLSSHPAINELCMKSNMILTSSSANLSGEDPVSVPEKLNPELFELVAGIYDKEPRPEGKEPSTIVEVISSALDEATIKILRRGTISKNQLEEAGFIVQEIQEG